MAIGQAQMGHVDHVEVTPRLFRFLCRDEKSKYITYGTPGVKVYPVGTKAEIDKVEKMTADNYYEYVTKEASKKAQ